MRPLPEHQQRPGRDARKGISIERRLILEVPAGARVLQQIQPPPGSPDPHVARAQRDTLPSPMASIGEIAAGLAELREKFVVDDGIVARGLAQSQRLELPLPSRPLWPV